MVSGDRIRGSLLVAMAMLGPLALLSVGCNRKAETPAERPPAESERILADVDSVMIELGGRAMADLQRDQRWRMVSSMGSGLPPANFKQGDLPEGDARGARLVGAYCIQCHWIPAPQMHSAAEWPLLVRRMLLRTRTLHTRMGGPMTEGLLGKYLVSGMASAQMPSLEDADSLIAYLQRNAMPAAAPGELGNGPEVEFFVDKCGLCHEAPSPAAHTAEEWRKVVARMRSNMVLMSVKPLSDEETRRVVRFLESKAGGS